MAKKKNIQPGTLMAVRSYPNDHIPVGNLRDTKVSPTDVLTFTGVIDGRYDNLEVRLPSGDIEYFHRRDLRQL